MFKTSFFEMNPILEELSELYSQEASHSMESNKTLILTMMIISVSSIFIITIAVLPNFSRIEDRKYRVLSYFFSLHNEIVTMCQDKTNVFEEEFYETYDLDSCFNDDKQGLAKM